MSNRIRIWHPEKTVQSIDEPVIVEVPAPKIEGWFTIQLLSANDKSVLTEYTFPNVITNGGMNNIGNGAILLTTLRTGQGSTTPSGTDTALVSALAGDSTTGDGFGETFGSGTDGNGMSYWFRRVNRIFTETQANGNITELGWLGNNGVLTVRALVRDSGGTPISITKTSDNQLRVIYEYRLYPPSGSDVTGTVTWGTNSYNFTIRPQNVFSTAWGSELPSGLFPGGITATMFQNVWGSARALYTGSATGSLVNPTGSNFNPFTWNNFSSINNLSYVNDTFRRDADLILEPAAGNISMSVVAYRDFSGGGTLTDATYPSWQILFSPPILKNNTQRLTLRFRSQWRRNRTVD